MIYFTADTHFDHDNIRKYCNRPFSTVAEMNETIIKNWNAVVKPKDIVYHLGDFAFIKTEARFLELFMSLRGTIRFVKGNHDKTTAKYSHYFDEWHEGLVDLTIDKQPVTLCHYAMRVWNKKHYDAWHLYGHSHGELDEGYDLSFDVGVDAQQFTPVSLEQVAQKMQLKKTENDKYK